MSDNKQYIVDENGNIQSVILDYKSFQQMEELLLDAGLIKAMEEVNDEEELSWDEVKLRVADIDTQIKNHRKGIANE
jgi:hypothetical protein